MNAPFLVRRDEVENDLFITVVFCVNDRLDCFRIDRRAIDAERFAKRAHPQMILIKLLAAGERPPRDQFMYIGVPGIVTDLFRLNAGPRRR